jgi:hypothetical protein
MSTSLLLPSSGKYRHVAKGNLYSKITHRSYFFVEEIKNYYIKDHKTLCNL